MKFDIGDKVVVLLSNEEGEVVEIINEKMVLVDVRGVRFPAYTDQLDFPYFKRFTEQKLFAEKRPPKKFIDEVPKEKKKPVDKVVDGVWLTFIPVMDTDEFGDDVVEALKVHLINRTEIGYGFSYSLNYFGDAEFALNNQVHAFEDFYLHDIPFADLNDSPTFTFEFSLITPDKKKAPHYESVLKLKPKQVFTRVEKLKENGEATFSYKLFDNYPDKAEEEKLDLSRLTASGYKVYDASRVKDHLEPAKYEVDLHIERLTPYPDELDSFEKLTLQLQTFEKYLELAIAHRQPAMVVIHGVGSGKLRDELHEQLRLRSDVKYFVNQYHPAYGYGATEIFFQYGKK